MRVRTALAAALAAGALLAPSAGANDIAPAGTVFSTDSTSAGFGGMRGIGSGAVTVTGVSGTVTRALLYWHGPAHPQDPTANASVVFAGNQVTGTSIGLSDDNCWAFANSQAYFADVTPLVPGNGSYSLANFVKPGVEINGVSLLVFYDDGASANDRDVVLFHGNDSNIPNPFDADGWNVSLPGITYSGGSAGIALHVSDGQGFFDNGLTINGQPFVAPGPNFEGDSVPNGPSAPNTHGGLWDIKSYDVTPFLTPGPNTLTLRSEGPTGDCLSLVVAAIDLPAGAAPREFQLALEPKAAVNPVGSSHTVTATLSDDDGPVADEEVLFTVTGANAGSGSDTTDDEGKAMFAWTGANAGDDDVVACHDANRNQACDDGEATARASKRWEVIRDGGFSCRATGLRVGTSELAVANPPGAPCRDDAKSVVPVNLGGVRAAAVNGTTAQTPDDPDSTPPAVGDGSSAYASAANVTLTVGMTQIKVAVLEASAAATCTAAGDSTPDLTSGGRVAGLTVNGRTIVVAGGFATVPLGVATLKVNETTTEAGKVTRRALVLDNLFLPDVVIAEAVADYSGKPCPSDGKR